MKKQTKLAIFEGKKIRRHWDEGQEKWYFSVVDVVAVLTDSTNPTDYLKKQSPLKYGSRVSDMNEYRRLTILKKRSIGRESSGKKWAGAKNGFNSG